VLHSLLKAIASTALLAIALVGCGVKHIDGRENCAKPNQFEIQERVELMFSPGRQGYVARKNCHYSGRWGYNVIMDGNTYEGLWFNEEDLVKVK
jgi:hypothetical protein